MARALEQIMQELNSVYDPQRDVYNKQINALPGQQQAQMKGLDAAKTDAFNQIVTGANRRGVAFGGIPLEEQQSYLGSSYLPAVANLKNRFEQNRFSLQAALQELAAKQRGEARDIYDREWAREQAEAAAARARAASGGGGGGGFNLGGFGGGFGGNVTGNAPATSNIPIEDQRLYNNMFYKSDGGQWDENALLSDYNATLKSARYGNERDRKKIAFYHMERPDLFGPSVPSFSGSAREQSTAAAAARDVMVGGNSGAPFSGNRNPLLGF